MHGQDGPGHDASQIGISRAPLRQASQLPVQGPVKFVLAINLKTAKMLDIDVPMQLEQRADEVIE